MRAFTYLVASLQYASLRRISNFAHTVADKARRRLKTVSQDPDDKHALRNKDVLVAVNPALRRGGSPVRCAACRHEALRLDNLGGGL